MTQRLYLRVEEEAVYGPESSVPTAWMREHAPAAPLRDLVAHVLEYRECVPTGAAISERVLPDGRARLVFGFGPRGCTARVLGPQTRAVVLGFTQDVDALSIQLRPGALPSLFGHAATELANTGTGWDQIAPPSARSLPERLAEARSRAQRVRLLQQGLASMAAPLADTELRRVRAALPLLAPTGRRPTAAAVAGHVGLGERRLQQLFQRHIGLSPQAWLRLARVHDCLRASRAGAAVEWADLAVRLGYYDQSHLVNEFRAACGISPDRFLRGIAESSKTPRRRADTLAPPNPGGKP